MHHIFPNKINTSIVLFLIFLNVFSWFLYIDRGRELAAVETTTTSLEHAKNVMTFQMLFVEKVLKSNGEVGYDDRRALEQAVGKTNDPDVIRAWDAFLAATTEAEGQARVKELLLVMAQKLSL